MMKNILLVGNGFDLAHGLYTNYKDFLFVIKNWDTFYFKYKSIQGVYKVEETDIFFKYVENAKCMDEKNIEKLGCLIKDNSWAEYFCNCEAEIDLWIDFEREIIPVMLLLEDIFKAPFTIAKPGNYFTKEEGFIEKTKLKQETVRIASLFVKYFRISEDDRISVRSSYISPKYGILKKKILKDLRMEFEQFVEAFELYLCEVVQKRSDVKPLEQLSKLNISKVISFNYTQTERLYGITDENSHHIHGKIRTNMNSEKNNMVLGINEQKDQNVDFIYFVKYFQRIQKGIGVKYKFFVDGVTYGIDIYTPVEKYILYIYGHSLDETDEDVLKYVIGDIDKTGTIGMKAEKLVVFYYDDEDYAQKVINLIKMYGRAAVEHNMEIERFEFIKASS